MATIQCDCADSTSIQNFGGVNECANGIGLPKNAILLINEKVDGTSNGINTDTDTLDQTFFDAKFQNPIAQDRWMYLSKIKQFTSPPLDPNTEEIDDVTIITSENPKEVSFVAVTEEAYKFAAKVNSHKCRNISIIYNDDKNNLIVDLVGVIAQGRKIQPGSFRAVVLDKEFATASKVQITFKYDIEALESNVDYIKQVNMGGFNIATGAVSLIDVRIDDVIKTIVTVAGINFHLNIDFGDVIDRIGAGGLSEVELDIYNVTTDTVETLSGGIVEGPILGSYSAAFTTPIEIGELIEVRGIGGDPLADYVQKGYDLKALIGVQEAAIA